MRLGMAEMTTRSARRGLYGFEPLLLTSKRCSVTPDVFPEDECHES